MAEKDNVCLHAEWTTKSRCVPDWTTEMERLNTALTALEERVAGRARTNTAERLMLGLPIGKMESVKGLANWTPAPNVGEWTKEFVAKGTLEVQKVKEWRKEVRELGCTPLDKVNGEAVFV